MSTKDYFLELAKTAGLDDETKAGLIKALENPKFAEEAEKGVKRQQDYSRSMDELRAEAKKLEADRKTWTDWYAEALPRDTERELELQELRKKVGTSTTSTTTTTAPETFSRKEIEEREGRTIQIIKQGMRLASRHAAAYKEELDVDALEKLAINKGLSLEAAYDEYVKPRVAEATQKEIEEKVRLAREEGLKEGLSKRDLPDESTRGFHPIHDHAKSLAESGKLTDSQRRENFINTWQESVKK